MVFVAIRIVLFKPVNFGPPALGNQTAIEPTTKVSFRMQIEGPKGRVLGVLGVSDWVYTIPIITHPKLSVAAIGLYVEQTEGKRRLLKFKDADIAHNQKEFEQVKESLLKGGMLQAMKFVMVTTPPNGRMIQWWSKHVKLEMSIMCPRLVEEEFKALVNFFPDAFKRKEEFTFERRENGLLYGYFGSDRSTARLIESSPCLGKALFAAHLREQGESLVNLLDQFLKL